ncbi:MAG: type II secretion system protein N [Thiohalomonadales bacterium]
MTRYIIIGVSFYFIFLLVTFPAGIVYAYWKEYFGQDVALNVSGFEGSIWSGRASSAVYANQKLQPIKWSVQPLNLILGQIALNWEFSIVDGYGKGQAGYSLLSGYFVKDLDAWLPVETITPLLKNAAALKPGGKLSIKMDELYSDGNNITAASGSLEWHDAEISLLKKMSLGNYHLDIVQADDLISGTVKDKGGPIDLQTDFSLTPAGDYEVNGLISLRDKERKDLRQALNSIGKANREGKIPIKQKGNISQLGL